MNKFMTFALERFAQVSPGDPTPWRVTPDKSDLTLDLAMARSPDAGHVRSQRGFSVVEVLLTTVLFSLLVMACMIIFMSGSDAWQVNSVRVYLQQEQRKAMDWIKEDLFEAGQSTITGVPPDDIWYNAITFKVPAGVSNDKIVWSTDDVQFVLGGADGDQLQRIMGATTKVLAQNVQSLQFRRQSSSPDVVEVAITGQKSTTRGIGVSGAMGFRVKLRN